MLRWIVVDGAGVGSTCPDGEGPCIHDEVLPELDDVGKHRIIPFFRCTVPYHDESSVKGQSAVVVVVVVVIVVPRAKSSKVQCNIDLRVVSCGYVAGDYLRVV